MSLSNCVEWPKPGSTFVKTRSLALERKQRLNLACCAFFAEPHPWRIQTATVTSPFIYRNNHFRKADKSPKSQKSQRFCFRRAKFRLGCFWWRLHWPSLFWLFVLQSARKALSDNKRDFSRGLYLEEVGLSKGKIKSGCLSLMMERWHLKLLVW